ncbi:MAG: hypothetical protein WDO13_09540 [Verrucomicrobiota bacterium]
MDAVTVTGLGLPSAPAQVLVTVRKATGGGNLFATVRGDSISTDGFTADPLRRHGRGDLRARLPADPMSAVWTIVDASGTEKAAADWGLSALTRERLNQAPDVVTFRAENAPVDADPVFAFGLDGAAACRGGVPWFYGASCRCRAARRAGWRSSSTPWPGRGGTWKTWSSSRSGRRPTAPT